MALAISRETDFQKVYQKGQPIKTFYFNLYFCPNESTENRLAVIASKKIGKAVKRNRAKRLLRESFRLLEKNCRKGFDLIFSAKNSLLGKKLNDVLPPIKAALIKAQIFTDENA